MRLIFFYIFIFCSATISSQINIDEYLQKRDSIIKSKINNDFPYFSTNSLDGNKISNDSLIGKITLMNFWFQGCSPCLAEFEGLNAIYHQYRANNIFQFLSFTFDNPVQIKQTIKKYNLPYRIYPISQEECYRLNFRSGFPTTIIINPKGKIVYFKTGGSLDKEKMKESHQLIEKRIEELLK